MSSFYELGLSNEILTVLNELKYTAPTAIQRESIPVLLAGRDLIGQSKTGSGKTAAFTIPLIQKLDLLERQDGRISLQGLILCPTRELSTQVAQEVRKLGRRYPGLKVVTLTGGMPTRPQKLSLEHGAHVVVGTPGRVLDHLRRGNLSFEALTYIVLDEADRMLEMGFQEEMDAILGATPKSAQMLLFSATFPSDIEAVSAHYQNDPHRVVIEETEDERAARLVNPSEATFLEVEESGKVRALMEYLRNERPESMVVFCNLKKTAARIAEVLTTNGFPSLSLHGDLEQFERDQVMVRFRNGSRRILVATDVAARGIDIEALGLVVNFDFPQTAEIYVHRVGRTGRAGRKGKSLLLLTPKQRERLEELEEVYGQEITRYEPGSSERISVTTESEASLDPSKGDILEAKLCGHWETLQIFGGRKDKLRPGDILGALTGEAGGLQGAQVGKIEIQDKHSFVAVDAKLIDRALKGLTEGRMKGRRFRVSRV